MPWFRANITAWLYEYAEKHFSKHSRVYGSFQLDIGACKRTFVIHQNAETTAVKRTMRTIGCDGKGRENLLKKASKGMRRCL